MYFIHSHKEPPSSNEDASGDSNKITSEDASIVTSQQEADPSQVHLTSQVSSVMTSPTFDSDVTLKSSRVVLFESSVWSVVAFFCLFFINVESLYKSVFLAFICLLFEVYLYENISFFNIKIFLHFFRV